MLTKIIEMVVSSVLNLLVVGKPDPKVWIFSSSYNNKYNYNSKYLFEYVFEFVQKKHAITPLYVINDDRLRAQLNKQFNRTYQELFDGEQPPHEFFISATSLAGKVRILKAGVWFTSAGLPVYQGLRKKSRLVINLWHGVPLKKIALMEENSSKLQKLFFRLVFSRNYTHVVTTSAELTAIMQASFDVDAQRVVVWGQPRNDRLVQAQYKFDLRKHFASLPIACDLPPFRSAILYAPTYRDEEPTRLFPFDDFDAQTLGEYLEREQIIIFLRCHQSERAQLAISHPRIVMLDGEVLMDVNTALTAFDLLITDYSSIYIDYLLLQRPMLFLPYDKDAYLKGRGLNFEYDAVTPGPKPGSLKQLMLDVSKLIHEPSYYAEERMRINQKFNSMQGPSSPLIVAEILNKFAKQDGELTAPLEGVEPPVTREDVNL